MSLTEALWLIGALWAAVGVLSGLVWNNLQKKIEDQQTQLDKHAGFAERLAAIESTMAANTDRIKVVGDQSHRYNAATADVIRDHTEKHSAAIERLHTWLTEQLLKRNG